MRGPGGQGPRPPALSPRALREPLPQSLFFPANHLFIQTNYLSLPFLVKKRVDTAPRLY